MLPPAPGRFSTTTCCPKLFAISRASRRAMVSALPPGGNGAMKRIGLDGYGWANAPEAKEKAAHRAATSSLSMGPRVGRDVTRADAMRYLSDLPPASSLPLIRALPALA